MRWLFSVLMLAAMAAYAAPPEDPGEGALQPLPEAAELDPRKVELGQLLFHDALLSRDGSVSCASCHDLNRGGASGTRYSTGITGKPTPVNAPTVFNAAFNFAYFWDGRAATLEEQVDGPLLDRHEMGSSWPLILSNLNADDMYRQMFFDIYQEPPSETAVKDALAIYQRSLVTPDARFDRYLRGDESALSDLEKRGYGLFVSHGCVSCHQGVNAGGNMFQTFGVIGDYFRDRGGITEADYGRYNVTKDENDRYVFKVPSLRNVALTAPYFHDGAAATLEEAIDIMGKYQLGRVLTEEEKAAIAAFLRTLTGTFHGQALEEPGSEGADQAPGKNP